MIRIAVLALALCAPLAAKDLRLIAIDVEGGAASLYITPGGKSLLIDAGFPTRAGATTSSSAERVAKAARDAGLKRIDHVLITHYHADHVGGVTDLVKAIPIGQFIDHGPNREQAVACSNPGNYPASIAYPRYREAIAGVPHRVMLAGDTLNLDGLRLTAVASDGDLLEQPMRGAGQPGQACETIVAEMCDGGDENFRSLGVVMQWGKARIISLGDAILQQENRLACPIDLIGRVDLMFASNHGSQNAGSEALLRTLRPRIVMVANGPTKGGDAMVLTRLKTLPEAPAVWQLHAATHSPEADTAAERIANIEATTDHNLAVTISDSGAIAIANPRTGVTTTYPR